MAQNDVVTKNQTRESIIRLLTLFSEVLNSISNDFDTKADKSELADYLTSADAANAYLGKNDKAASATTADTLTTRRILYISDRTSANTGPGVFFSGGSNITIKMPAAAEFERLTAGTLVLGTDTSTVEGAMWLEWS